MTLALALSLVAVATGCLRRSSAEAPKENTDTREQAVPVEVVSLARGPIESVIKTAANLEAEQEVKVLARTANRVAELKVEEGDQAAQDQVLLRLEDDLQKTQFAKAQSRLEKARKEFERLDALFAQKLVSEQVHTDARFELRQLELALEDAQRELDYTTVRAPIAGVVTRRLVKLGDLVNLNQPLFDLVDFHSIVARVYVPEKSLPLLATNQVARVTPTAPGIPAREAFLRRIAPVVEPKTATVKVTFGFREIGQLRPGMYVDVEIIVATQSDALLLSKRALVYDSEQMYVFRLRDAQRVERVLVEAQLTDKLHVSPVAGFQAGDRIVVAGQTGLKDGAWVRLPGSTNAPALTPPRVAPAAPP